MDDLGEKITKILSDPGSMQQIMDLAAAMGLKPPDVENNAKEETQPPVLPQPEILENFSNMLHRAENQEKKQEALFRALRPYLKPGRQERLERALQISKLSHLASAAIRSGRGTIIKNEGGDPSV